MNKAYILVLALLAISTHAYLPGVEDTVNQRFDLSVVSHRAIQKRYKLRAASASSLSGGDDIFSCMSGFAYGLQFNTNSAGGCYTSLSEFIDSMSTITDLSLQAYDPTTWADLVQAWYNFYNYFASVNSNCNFQKLLNTITNAIGEGLSTMAARVAGGMINELPSYYLGFFRSTTCFT